MGALQKRTRVEVTQEQIKQLHQSMQRCWNAIAMDCLQATADDEGKNINRVTMPKDHVIDVVIDQMESNGEMNKELRTLWSLLPFEQMQEIAEQTFKHSRYGM